MADIKTRDAVKGTIKTLDKTVIALILRFLSIRRAAYGRTAYLSAFYSWGIRGHPLTSEFG